MARIKELEDENRRLKAEIVQEALQKTRQSRFPANGGLKIRKKSLFQRNARFFESPANAKLPTTASEHSSSLSPGLLQRRLRRKPTDRNGHPRDRPLFGFIAEKRSLTFRFPEAAVDRTSCEIESTPSPEIWQPRRHQGNHLPRH
jgi:hypothetical protein